MKSLADTDYLKDQYRSGANLNARIALHARFSRNPLGWHHWIYTQMALPPDGRILELGCGNGALWSKNRTHLSSALQLTLTDASTGMLTAARAELSDLPCRVRYAQLDAARLPFPAAAFDVVIANHMLYHVADLASALAGIQRVLRPGGRLYAATNGVTHQSELHELAARFDPRLNLGRPVHRLSFTLENGAKLIAGWFPAVEVRRYIDSLDVTDAGMLTDYILSCEELPVTESRRCELETWLQAEIDRLGGIFRISTHAGVFITEAGK